MVAVLAALGAAFLIWFHNDARPRISDTTCHAPIETTVHTGPWHEEVKIEFAIQAD